MIVPDDVNFALDLAKCMEIADRENSLIGWKVGGLPSLTDCDPGDENDYNDREREDH